MGCGVHSKGNTVDSHRPHPPSLLPFILKNYIGPEIETVPGPDPSESPGPVHKPQTFTHAGTLTTASMGAGVQPVPRAVKEKADIEDLEAM